MFLQRTLVAAGIIVASLGAASLGLAWGEDAVALKPTVAPLLTTSTTIIGQPLVYPAGTAQVTAAIITIPPGGETGWHVHQVPLIGYILEGQLTVDYGAKGTHTYAAGEALAEAMNWPHNGMNKGTVPVRLLAVYAGAAGIANAEPVAH
jgi:quercetin dioxygenase-like cupin family protein